tara:strand:- start:49766 stop:50368 length:603 start_codon:yes stop_codon:yes gene_type:complete
MNLNRIIERESPTGFTMAQPPFPCFAWQSESSVDAKKLLQAFLEQRPSPQWVMVGDGCVQSNLQLWTAWMSASRRWIRKTSLARSIDAEFLRYLSGTHHVSEAFKRAGVRNKDNSGYVLFLPEASADEEEIDCQIVEYDSDAIELQAKEILAELELEVHPTDYALSKQGALRLGMKFEFEQETLTESALIGHILSSEFTS